MALADSLISYYKADEASGNLLDAHGTNELVETGGTIDATTGIINGARDIEAGDNEYFTIDSNASVQTGDIDFTFAAWVQIESEGFAGVTRDIVSKFVTSGTNSEYLMGYLGSDTSSLRRFRFLVRNAANSANVSVSADNLGKPALATWYYVIGWHDAAANTINIQVDNGTVDSLSHTGGVFSAAAPFRIGARGNATSIWDGLIDEVGFWKRVLTADERTDLYNSGNGRDYAYIISAAAALIDNTTPIMRHLYGMSLR